MDIQGLCRVCLAGSSKMHNITNPQLQEVYEKLAGNKLETEDRRSTMLCFICYAHLRKCYGFLQAAQKSDAVLTQLYTAKIVFMQDLVQHPPVHNYSITPTEYVNYCGGDRTLEEQLSMKVKSEVFECAPEEEEVRDISDSLADHIKVDAGSEGIADNALEPDSDSEDDVPLKTFKTQNGQVKVEKEKRPYKNNTKVDPGSDSEDDVPLKSSKTENVQVKVEKEKRPYKTKSKLDVHEITLTKEQQIQDVLSRATSLNYLNSPFQCKLCYRGFVSIIAYRNHAERHDERSGPHQCDVCRMRYRSARLLRSHAALAHARLYRCNKCRHVSHTKHQANDHERWHDGHTYQCQLCGQSFTKRTSYLTHARTRHATEHVCAACGERFVSRHGLRMHQTKAHGRANQEVEESSAAARFCADCNIEFHSIRAWQRHFLASSRHTLRAQHTKQCPLCGGVITGSLADHLKEHERKLRPPHLRPPPPATLPLARLSCEQCGASFVNKAKLSAHVKRIHLGLKYNKNIVCEVCGKKCTSNAALKYHQRTHTGERPHACPVCGKQFSDSNQLRIHARTHTGEKPYSCEHCAKNFSQKAALNRHYRVHTGAKPYTCEVCSKSFSQSNSLKGHVRAVHLKMPPARPRIRPTVGHKTDVTGEKSLQDL